MFMERYRLRSVISFLLLASTCFAADKLDVCDCKPRDEKPTDYRYAVKHIALPSGEPKNITVDEVLAWEQGPDPKSDAPRKGRELQLMMIPRAYVQFAWAYRGDCDIHIEISATPDKDAPRIVVEIPVDPEYCPARKTLQSALRDHGGELSVLQQEVAEPFPVTVRGLPYQDFDHKRGSKHVATVWEIHPAVLDPIGDTSKLRPSDGQLLAVLRKPCHRKSSLR